jgi:hypothetical protein
MIDQVKHQIEIDIDSIEDSTIRNFVLSEIDHCTKNNIKVKLLKAKVDHNGIECSGVFEDEPVPCLTVDCNKDIKEWLLIFIHETCHKDQFLEKVSVWTEKIGGQYEPLDIFDMWVEGYIELKKQQLRLVLKYIVNIELDCEKRSIEKIKKYKLPVNQIEYIQKSNAYVYYYHAVAAKRSYTDKSSPYVNPNIWTKMPKTFDNDYTKLKKNLLKLYNDYCY